MWDKLDSSTVTCNINNEMKNTKYHTVRTVPKCNQWNI